MKINITLLLILTIIFFQKREIYSQNLFGTFSGGKILIMGESKFGAHADEIEVISYQLELQKNTRGAENKIFIIVKNTDAASTTMFQAMNTSDLKTFKLENYQTTKSGDSILKTVLELEKAQIVNIRQWYDEAKQKTIEEVKLTYNKLKMSYKPKKQEVEIIINPIN